MPTYAVQSPSNPMRGLFRGDVGYSFGALGNVAIVASPNGVSRAAGGIVTLTTSANHNFAPGEIVTLADAAASKLTSVGGTRFGGNYMIQATPSATTATLLPLDEIILHQGPDTGGGGQATSIQFENPVSGTAGKAFALAGQTVDGQQPSYFTVNGLFQSAPTFEVDVQVADVDAANRYQTVASGNITVADATNFTFHFDANTSGARFARLFMKTNTGNVGFIGTIRG